MVLFIVVVASFAYRRLKQERSKQGGGVGSQGGGVGSQNRADVDLLVAINSSTPRVTRWLERGLIFNLLLNNIVLYRRAPPPPYSGTVIWWDTVRGAYGHFSNSLSVRGFA